MVHIVQLSNARLLTQHDPLLLSDSVWQCPTLLARLVTLASHDHETRLTYTLPTRMSLL